MLRGDYGIDDAGYGSLFLPQMACTVAGSLGGASLARRVGLKRLLAISTALAASAALALESVSMVPPSMRLAVLLLGTGLMGSGFGLAAAPLNALPARFFPSRADSALVALHTVMGGGLALGPLAVSGLVAHHAWTWFPIAQAVACVVVALGVALTAFPPEPVERSADASAGGGSRVALGLLVVIAVLYAFCEGTFASWASIFLAEDRHVAPELAALALSAFWAAIAVGRLVISAIVVRVPAERVWLALLVLVAVAFFVVPFAHDATSGIAAFALAGLGCSAFFPITVGLGTRVAASPATASSLLVAALMVGVGSSSFALGALRAHFPLEQVYRLSIAYPVLAFVLAIAALRAMPKKA